MADETKFPKILSPGDHYIDKLDKTGNPDPELQHKIYTREPYFEKDDTPTGIHFVDDQLTKEYKDPLQERPDVMADNPFNLVDERGNIGIPDPNNPKQSFYEYRGSATLVDQSTNSYSGYQNIVGDLDHYVISKHENATIPSGEKAITELKAPKYTRPTGDSNDTGAYADEALNPFGQEAYNAAPFQSYSPLHSFTRTSPHFAHQALFTAYNRTKLPIADIEHRKAFRHIFITRPECYICGRSAINDDYAISLSKQAAQDEEFYSSYQRFPYICETLSPVYICNAAGNMKYANWNYLLSNRVQGLNTAATTISAQENMIKGTMGGTVMPGSFMNSMFNNNLELSFRDTKYMDVYEMIRMWMWYIHKRTSGEFYPPFNGYQRINSWNDIDAQEELVNKMRNTTKQNDASQLTTSLLIRDGYSMTHPYDRALEYCSSIFDIVVDETGSKILYWCKYYGVYPISVTNGMLSNDKNQALTGEANISVSFKYQFKAENIIRNLYEFNYNAGILNAIGNTDHEISQKDFASFVSGSVYAGAAGMITGSPCVAMKYESNRRNPFNPADTASMTPYLIFLDPGNIPGAVHMNTGIQGDSNLTFVAQPTSDSINNTNRSVSNAIMEDYENATQNFTNGYDEAVGLADADETMI